MSKDIENTILLDLYEEYGFIENDMSKFKDIVFSNASKNMSEKELRELGKKNIIIYLVKEVQSGKFVILFKKALEKLEPMKAFVLFDTIIEEADIDISEDAILGLALNQTYQGFYDNYVNNKNKFEGTLLGKVLDAYTSINEEDIEIGESELISNLSDDQVRDYLLLISGISVLTREEEQFLLRKYKETNDPYYKDEFINHNLRLAAKLSLKYWKPMLKMSRMDLIQEGNLGLMEAFDRFDPTKGYKFSTYAIWWINQKVTRAIADQNDTVRIPVHCNEKIAKKNNFIKEYEDKYFREPTDEEIMDALGVDEKELKLIKKAEIIKSPNSIDYVVDNQESRAGRESSYGQFIADDSKPSVEDEALSIVEREQLLEIIEDVLTKRERIVIRARMGFNEYGETFTLEKIGEKLGVTRERIRQIESKALKKIERRLIALKNAEKNMSLSNGNIDPHIIAERKEIEIRLKNKKNNLRVVGFTPDNSRVTVKCLECQNSYTDTPEKILSLDDCLFCYAKKVADEEDKKDNLLEAYNKKLIEGSNGKIIAIRLEDDKRYVTVRCLDCGFEWTRYRYNLLTNPVCPKCYSLTKIEKQKQTLKNRIRKLNDRIEIVEYIGSREKARFRCLDCKNEWDEFAYNLLRKPYCLNCKNQKVKKK